MKDFEDLKDTEGKNTQKDEEVKVSKDVKGSEGYLRIWRTVTKKKQYTVETKKKRKKQWREKNEEKIEVKT